MDIRKLAGGVLCVGFDGVAVDERLSAELRELMPGGVALFGRNIVSFEQTRALCVQLRALFGVEPPPIIAVDQEGGRVARLTDGVAAIPAMMALGATGDCSLARRAGAQMAYDLRRCGVNLNFAPSLDLAQVAQNTVIGARSFGSDPRMVARLAGAVADGMRENEIVPTFKHFPGHGSTAEDSHLGLPILALDAQTLQTRDLFPFATLLPQAEAVMTAHIVIEAVDAQHPATLSSLVLTQMLRGELGFAGVCFTDCMQMDAIAKSVGVAQGAVLGLLAGADCITISHSIEIAAQSADAIVAAVESGELPLSRLREAYDRVQRLRWFLASPLAATEAAPDPEVGLEIARRAVTLLRGEHRVNPADTAVISFEGTTQEGVVGVHSLHASLSAMCEAGIQEYHLPLEPALAAVEALIGVIPTNVRQPIILMRRAHIYPEQASAIATLLKAKPDSVLISVREPFDVALFPQARTVLCTYGDERVSLQGLGEVLFGGVIPSGKLPVTL
ncbi:MAG: beta-N-acetylhexosaminidase [Candidatus Eremiobacteraeota bacterium]|nr:beta-N-acetylhexosaminidase [Candidatus Eremiobacteraeota bacterium]